MPQIGFLRLGPQEFAYENFRQELRDLEYAEGQTVALEARLAGDDVTRFPALAAELVRLKVDIIVTSALPASRVVSQASRSIPIVMVSADPVGADLVASLADPRRNSTGLSNMLPDKESKRLELLRLRLPRVTRVAYLWDPDNSALGVRIEELQTSGQQLDITAQSVGVHQASELERAFAIVVQERAGALLPAATLGRMYRGGFLDFMAKQRLPAITDDASFVKAGALMVSGPDNKDHWSTCRPAH